jgi:hypothetical protein
MASLIVASRIEIRIALSIVLRPVIDALIAVVGIIHFTAYTTAPDISASRIEVGIAVPIELRSTIDPSVAFSRPVDQTACSMAAVVVIRRTTGDYQKSSRDDCIDCEFHDHSSSATAGCRSGVWPSADSGSNKIPADRSSSHALQDEITCIQRVSGLVVFQGRKKRADAVTVTTLAASTEKGAKTGICPSIRRLWQATVPLPSTAQNPS